MKFRQCIIRDVMVGGKCNLDVSLKLSMQSSCFDASLLHHLAIVF